MQSSAAKQVGQVSTPGRPFLPPTDALFSVAAQSVGSERPAIDARQVFWVAPVFWVARCDKKTAASGTLMSPTADCKRCLPAVPVSAPGRSGCATAPAQAEGR